MREVLPRGEGRDRDEKRWFVSALLDTVVNGGIVGDLVVILQQAIDIDMELAKKVLIIRVCDVVCERVEERVTTADEGIP